MTLHNAVQEVLGQVMTLISSSRPVYNQTTPMVQSPIGKHIRHILDHFRSLEEGLKTGIIDYTLRHRNTAMESDPDVAQATTERLIAWVGNLSNDNPSLKVINEISVSEEESLATETNLERELIYLINHTLHHVAYASLLANVHDVKTPNHLGIAPSTATYMREEQAACAR